MVCGIGKTQDEEKSYDNILNYLHDGHNGESDLPLWSNRADGVVDGEERSGNCYNSVFLYPLEEAGLINFRGEHVWLTDKAKKIMKFE